MTKKKEPDSMIEAQEETLDLMLQAVRAKQPELLQAISDLIDDGRVEQVMRIIEKATATLEKSRKMYQAVGNDEVAVMSHTLPSEHAKAKRIDNEEPLDNET